MWKLKSDMDFDLKSLIRARKELNVSKGVLNRRTLQVNKKCKFQLILHREYRERTMEGCHNQISHPGKYRTLEIPRDRLHWPGMLDILLFHT